MKSGAPFIRARMMMAALASLASLHGAGTSAFQTEASKLGPYSGRGKGRTRFHHGPGNGASKSQRAARKARNVARFRGRN